MLGVSANTISNLIARHELQSLKIGSRRLIDTADLRAFIAARKGVQS
jgi:excisionase family DNA binding protein